MLCSFGELFLAVVLLKPKVEGESEVLDVMLEDDCFAEENVRCSLGDLYAWWTQGLELKF